jgi:cell wall-associated NlpC family hydrolase
VREAREWVDTPYAARQWRKHQGADCIGLGIGVAQRIGAFCPPDTAIPEYGPFPHNHVAERTADLFMHAVPGGWDEAQPGRLGLFFWKTPGHGQHFCIFGDGGSMIHAFMGLGRVTEQQISPFWRKRLLKIYEYKGLAG